MTHAVALVDAVRILVALAVAISVRAVDALDDGDTDVDFIDVRDIAGLELELSDARVDALAPALPDTLCESRPVNEDSPV